MIKQTQFLKSPMREIRQNCNWGTALELSVEKLMEGLNLIY